MKAIILAAGLGSRLKELTSEKPKALIEVNGMTMLEIVIKKLSGIGITDFLVNIHHHGQKVIDYLLANDNFGMNITISDEREELLDTGGAILKATDFIKGHKPVLIHNVDIISDVDLNNLVESHNKNIGIATLCVRKRNSTRGLLFNDEMQLTGWTNIEKNEFKWVSNHRTPYEIYAFSGIYIIEPHFTDLITQTGKFSIINTWLEVAKNNKIYGYIDKSPRWHDLGTIEKIKNAENEID